MSSLFAAAADAWRALLADSDGLHFLQSYFDTAMAMAVALAQPQAEKSVDWDAVKNQFATDEEEQLLLAFVFVLQDLVEVVVRENMAFLVDDMTRVAGGGSISTEASAEQSSASQREAVAQQDALVQRLPEGFRLAFIKALRTHWATLRSHATDHGVRLNRLSHMSWRIARPYVLMRIVFSNHKQRIIKVPMTQFHQLRYSTAKVLQEMNQVEAHPIMRLTNLDQSRTAGRLTVVQPTGSQGQGDGMP